MTITQSLRVSSYAVCLRDSAILLARWVNPHHPGETTWTLPGGKIEHGEDPYDAAVREVYEETGYHIEIDELLGMNTRVNRYPRENGTEDDLHSLRIYYTAHIISGELRNEIGGSTDLAAWIALDRLAELDCDPCIDAALSLAGTRPPTGRPEARSGS